MLNQRIALVTAVWFLLSGCDGTGSLDEYSISTLPASGRPFSESSELILEYVRSFGPGELPPSFTYHGPAGVSRADQMLLRSHTDCKWAVLDLISGRRVRYFGRCGDGPHETRAVAGAGIFSDTIVFADVRSALLRFVGSADTVGRRLQIQGLDGDSIQGVHSLTVLDDTTAFVTLAVSGRSGSAAPLFGFVDLRTGNLRPVPFHLTERRRASVPEAEHFFGACTHRAVSMIIAENNGPAELLGLALDGRARWARRGHVAGLVLKEGDASDAPSAAFRWNRLPVRPACTATLALSRFIPQDGPSRVAPLGVLVLTRFDGTVAMGSPFAARDSVLALANWFADDSLFYVATTQAMTPRVLAFRPRRRAEGDEGPFAIPDSIRAAMTTDLILSDR